MAIRAMVWATEMATGTAAHVLEVEAGLACACVCPGCGAVLEAVNSRNPRWKKRPHFRHHAAPESEDCTSIAMLAAAKAVIAELDSFELPASTVEGRAASADGVVFTEVVSAPPSTQAVTHYDFVDIADAVLTLADGQQVYVRLVAHSISYDNLQPKQGALTEILIDIADPALQGMERNALRRYIALSAEGRVWCKNQALQLQADRLAMQRAQAYDANKPARLPHPDEGSLPGVDRPPLRPPSPKPTYREPISFAWSSAGSPVRTDAAGVREWRNFYKDGAYRLFAPRVDFDRILREAQQARAEGRTLAELLASWRVLYNLDDDLKPIARVLRAAGLVKAIT